jgi:F0F1-type ATP synthase assembly protein I
MITAEQAWQAVAERDWPGAMAGNSAGFTSARVWLPFDPKTGRNAVAPGLKELASLRLPALVRTGALPKPLAGDALVPSADPSASLRVPCWIFATVPPGAMLLLERSSDRAEPYWAAVEATSGAVLGGRLPAVRLMAHLRLWALLCLMLIGMSVALGVVLRHLKWPTEWVRNCVVAGALDARTLIGVSVVLAGLGYLGWRFRAWFASTVNVIFGKGLPPWLIEPAMRADRGELRFPSDQRWRQILRAYGWILLASLVLQFIFVGGLLSLAPSLRTFWFIIAILCGFVAAALAIHRSRTTTPDQAPPSGESYRGPSAVLVESVLRVMALAMAGLSVGAMIFYVGVLVGSDYLIHGAGSYMAWATHFGALVGSALVPAPGRARITLSVAVIAEWLLGVYLDSWLTAIIVAIVVVGISLPPRQSPGDTLRRRIWAAAPGAWRYSLGAAIGRMGGRVLGTLLLGPLGAVIGETVGEPVLAALGWLHSQREPYGAGTRADPAKTTR